jgi:hypothetical protein
MPIRIGAIVEDSFLRRDDEATPRIESGVIEVGFAELLIPLPVEAVRDLVIANWVGFVTPLGVGISYRDGFVGDAQSAILDVDGVEIRSGNAARHVASVLGIQLIHRAGGDDERHETAGASPHAGGDGGGRVGFNAVRLIGEANFELAGSVCRPDDDSLPILDGAGQFGPDRNNIPRIKSPKDNISSPLIRTPIPGDFAIASSDASSELNDIGEFEVTERVNPPSLTELDQYIFLILEIRIVGLETEEGVDVSEGGDGLIEDSFDAVVGAVRKFGWTTPIELISHDVADVAINLLPIGFILEEGLTFVDGILDPTDDVGFILLIGREGSRAGGDGIEFGYIRHRLLAAPGFVEGGKTFHTIEIIDVGFIECREGNTVILLHLTEVMEGLDLHRFPAHMIGGEGEDAGGAARGGGGEVPLT